MIMNYKNWKSLFIFCLGIVIGTTFCMKWLETDFIHNGNLFTIIGLEITYSKERIISIFSEIDPAVKSILKYQLFFDFVFMAGVYPGIASLCMMARERSSNTLFRKVLVAAALLQILALSCDILENLHLMKWLNKPVIGNEFVLYHYIVAIKWILAITALIIAIIPFLKSKKVS